MDELKAVLRIAYNNYYCNVFFTTFAGMKRLSLVVQLAQSIRISEKIHHHLRYKLIFTFNFKQHFRKQKGLIFFGGGPRAGTQWSGF